MDSDLNTCQRHRPKVIFSPMHNAAQQLLYLPLFSRQTDWCMRDSDSKASDSLLISGEQNSTYEKAAESLKKVFGSGREQEIFLGISKRYCQRESVVEAEQKKRADAVSRVYYTAFRQDALRLVHPDQTVLELLKKPCLSLDDYRTGLEMAYPMFYLSVGIHMFGTEKIKFSELYVQNEIDPDSRLRVKHFFIRACGFTFMELITTVAGHEIFQEDPILRRFKDYVKELVNDRVAELVTLSFPEEAILSRREKMNKAQILGAFFDKRNQYCHKGHAPGGVGSFKQWAMTPGTVFAALFFPSLT